MNDMIDQNIAIIGMACRFPDAKNYTEFWNNLVSGVNSIQEIPSERWNIDKYYSPNIDEPNKSISKWCGLLDQIDQFDNRFFSISPREAKQMDPQQRLLLEETWHCVEDSGVSLKTLQEKTTAVYVGVMASDYLMNAAAPHIVTDSYAALGNYDCILANRISYTFGFIGPSQSIDAACAASMVAMHNAKASLLSGESDYAIAAGVSLNFHPWKYISFSKSRMLSPDGQCKTFDKDANGYVPGEGLGVLLLQPLDDALRAHNHIYGIIKGGAVNHGGQTLSITAPSVEAQRDVILAAYKDAGINPDTVTYVEAHGTGTSLGDPIEVEALTWAFREYTDARHFCQIGSVKTNIGHLEAAAGIAGVIKVLLMMQHQQIPPTLNIKTLNPVINFEHSPFVVATQLHDWSPHCDELPVLRASVSSFGFGGVNSHTLLESFSRDHELPNDFKNEVAEPKTSEPMFILSAKSENALKKTFLVWNIFVESKEYYEYNLKDICATVMTGRSQFPYRYGCYVQDKEELKAFLQKDIPSIAKPDTHKWCLHVGELVWENFANVQLLLEQVPLIQPHLNTVVQCLGALEVSDEINNGFIGPAWPQSLKPLYSFMVNYAYLSALIELGFAPSLITGEKAGLWCALTLSDMMTLEDALAVLSTQKTLEQIKLVRPQVPFYDQVIDKTHKPYRFDEDYLHFLVDDLSITTADVHHFVERARLLKDSQFTFKKYLEEWGLILRQHTNLDLDSMLFNDRLISSEDEKSRKEQVLLMLIIKSSLRQLDQKWDLTRTKRIKEKKFQELLDLVIDGVMPKETVVELFMGGEIPDITGIATLLNKRQEHLNASKPYQFLNKHCQYLPGNANLSQWFEKAMVSSPTVPAIPHRQFLEFGQSNQPSTPNSDIKIALIDKPDNAFKDTLLKLWLKGVDIKWDILYPDGTFNKVSLPTYGFERSAFWLTKADEKALTQPKSVTEPRLNELLVKVLKGTMPLEELIDIYCQENPEMAAKVITANHQGDNTAPNRKALPNLEGFIGERWHYRRTVSPQDSMIRDHIITGKPMMPGAYMIEWGMGAIKRTLNQSVNLHNVVFKNPAIIETEVEIEVEIHPVEKRFILKTETQELCEAEYEPKTNKSFPSLDLSSITLGQPQKTEQIYESLSRLGYQYGKGLQVIENIWQYEDNWLFELKVSTRGKEPKTQLNSALLDGFFQTVLIVEYFLAGQPPKDNLHVPYIIKSFNVLSEMTDPCFVCFDKQDIQKKGGDLYAQLRAYNAAGEGILQIQGMVFKQVSTQFLNQNVNSLPQMTVKKMVSDEVYFYQPTWVKRALSPQTRDLSQHHAIVFMIDNPLATHTIIDITQRYQKFFVINKGSTFARQESDKFEINATQERDYVTVIQEIFSQHVNHPIEGYDIYYLWAYTPEAFSTFDESEFQAQIELGVQTLFFLTKALSTLERKPTINLLVGTNQSLIVTDQDKGEGYGYGSLFGLAQTVMLENPSLTIKIVDFAQENPSATLLLDENISQVSSPRIAYRDQDRYVQAIEPVSLAEIQDIPLLKNNGVYLLMGGLGSIGFQIAAFISQQVRARLVLIGRSELSEEQQQRMTQLQNTGSDILYRKADVTNMTQMTEVITNIKRQYGAINGVIQASGVLEDKLLLNKDWESFQRVLSPKVQGTWIINQLTQTEPLDFFVVFSSIVAITGNIGQVDYAAANSFLDSFIHYRSRNNYPGKSLSINWTLWAEGGMGQNSSVIEAFAKKAGVISNQTGLNAFTQLLNSNTLCQCIVAGHSQVFESNLANHSNQANDTKAERVNPIHSNFKREGTQITRIKKELSAIIASKIDTTPSTLDDEESFFSMGVESIVLQEIMAVLDKKYGRLPATLLFEYPNIRQLADYLNDRLPIDEKILQSQSIHEEIKTQNNLDNERFQEVSKPVPPLILNQERQPKPSLSDHSGYRIAIIGMNGRFPKSPNIESYWQNLLAGRDCIEEIPAGRWEHQSFFDVDPNTPNKTYGKWGGFIENVDKFDPLFFNISPREAEQMDPQQRLFLECTWETMEQAGYGDRKQYQDKIVGLYVGSMWNEYSQLSNQEGFLKNQYVGPGSLYWLIANRVSYFMDFTGPSLAVDTACSSSLVAVHLACQSILTGECDMAIAGGINLSIHPSKYIYLGQAKFLSKDGKCRSFGQDGSGYVPGEGVGAVLLKSLEQARQDGDHIYGIIRGSSTNHGGKATGFTVPNPKAQTRLITNALERAKVSAPQISYVECHGTGTSLGDPIEIEGLSQAFRGESNKNQSCPIGSVKSNIGHLEAAAGIAALIKVMLCMAHNKIPKSLHSEAKNPNINFEQTPFYVVNQTIDWISEPSKPKIAGISSFGAGGANAHLILEEYKPSLYRADIAVQESQLIVLSAKNEDRLHAYIKKIIDFLNPDFLNPARIFDMTGGVGTTVEVDDTDIRQQIQPDLLKVASEILKISDKEIDLDETFSELGFDTVNLTSLSHWLNDKYQVLMTPTLLSEYSSLAAVAQYLCDNSQSPVQESRTTPKNRQANLSLANLAYTLQVGREAMAERLAMVASSVDDLKEKLTQYVQGSTEIDDFYRGNVKQNKAQIDLLIDGKAGEAFLRIAMEEKELTKLAQLWISGVNINWQLLYGNQKPQRISLPTYPFARERYWIPTSDKSFKIVEDVKGQIANLHSLLDSNESTLEEQCFKKVFFGEEFYLKDHQVGSLHVLPAVVYLEMALAAGNLANRKTSVNKLANIVWARPITVSDRPVPVHISLYPKRREVEFEVSTIDDNGERQVHVQGQLNYENKTVSETLDIEAIQNRCFETWDSAKCYQLFQTTGLNYGPSFQTIQTLYRNDSEALSRLQLATSLKNENFVLHPSLMDGALQTVISLMGDATSSTPYLPFAVDEVELVKPLSETCYAYVCQAEHSPTTDEALKTFNLAILDEAGFVSVRLKNMSFRALKRQTDTPVKIYYQSVWKTSKRQEQTGQFIPTGAVLLFDTDDTRHSSFKERLKSEVILVMPGASYQMLGRDTYSIRPQHPADYRQLLATLIQQHGLPSNIIHLWSQASFVSESMALNAQLEVSLFSIFHLSQALLEQKPLEPIQLLYIYLETPEALQPQYAALSGFAKTIRLENPKLSYKTIAVSTLDKVMDIVLTDFQMSDGVEIRYDDNQRWVKRLQEFDEAATVDAEITNKLKENGVYLITGGAGGLGLIFAEYLAKNFKAKLVLTGRSELTDEQTDKIQSLNTFGAEVIYLQADVSKRDDVGTLIAQTKSHFNEINGVIHSAGVIKDALVLKKTSDEIAAVLAPKVYGTVYLDEFTQNDPLDFFMLFSSVAAVMGNMGQCDYAYANGFMDNFAAWRSEQRTAQKRFGKTLSINWPLWQDGGMQVDDFALAWLKQVMGLMPLSTETGILAFETSFHWPTPQMMVAEGFADKIKSVVNNAATVSYHVEKPHQKAFGEPEQAQLLEQTEQYLKEILSKETKLTTSAIQAHEPLEKYGIDSVMVMSLTRQLENDFGELSKTLLFEYQTLQELAGYFIQHHQETLIEKLGLTKAQTTESHDLKVTEDSEIESLSTRAIAPQHKKLVDGVANPVPPGQPDLISEDIAIIGVSGRYPQANDLTAFWDNLTQGKDCITEIPPTRWDYNLYYDPEKKADKIYNKWGGFIDDVDKFDPLFFNMSSREAEITDPQERLFLETVWHTLEDAGYTKTQLWQKQVGVFVGVMWGEYQMFWAEEMLKGHPMIAPDSSYASIANRVSYSFNFTGPSLALDTMCSSSLTTIHLACESLKRGESKLAIAGGVNVSIHPKKYLLLSQRMFVSSDGRCRSFGEGGDGYVPGEGVGAVLLKPLAQARADGDHIYAVIKGSSINHGGKTNGYTVPNPNAQAQLIATVLKQSKIDPRTISYVEAHGTGTPLGDPIEITGLIKSYQAKTSDTQYCSIGSVKSNIGHLESAAGIAGLTKVLLQMKYKQLVPSLHSERLNPNINFTASPFYVQQTLTEWQAPIIKENGTEKRYPRRAAISAFGAGGANAHLIVEEYQPPVKKIKSVAQQPQIIILSAKNAERLHVYINKIIDCLNPNLSMTDMAYTLQVGREAMEERLAMLVSSFDELNEKLTQYSQGNTEIEKVYRGNVNTHQTQSELLIEGEEGQDFIKSIIKRRKLSKLAQLWVAGIDIDWQLLYPNSKPQRISLPTYPFARERYWFSLTSPQKWASSGKMPSLHPLCDRIVPKLSLNQGVVFQKTLNKTDWIVKDHQVRHQPILPGVGYLEMAYVAGTLVTENTNLKLTRVIWRQPLVVLFDTKEVQIVIQENSEQLTYQIQSRENTGILTHATGEIHPAPIVPEQRVSIEEIKARCVHHIEKETFYNRFQDNDIQYGAYFQGVSEVWGNAKEALSRIELPEALEHERQHYTLHPTLMDGALQTIAGIGTDLNTSKGQPLLPFAIEAVEILQPLSANSYAYVIAHGSQRFQVAILDETGLVCIKCRDVSLRALPDPLEHLFYIPRWEQSVLTPLSTVKAETSTVSQTILIVYPSASLGLEKALAACHHQDEIRFIQLGTTNQQLGEHHWEISTSDTLALQRCFESWERLNIIYYLGGIQSQAIEIDNLEALEQSQERGVLSLFRLIKALSHQGLTQQPLQLNVITTDVFGITSQEEIQPFAAGLYGLSKVIANEYSQLTVRCIDMSLKDIKANTTQYELRALVAPLLLESELKWEEIAFREGKRYVRNIEAIKLPAVQQTPFKHQGVYLILGGAGGLGLELSLHLAKTVQARLILLGRRELSATQLNTLSQIEAQGGQVLYLRADATDLSSMQTTIEQAKSQFGQINGVIHSAIVLSSKTINNMDEDTFRVSLAPKVQGSVVLHKVLQNEPLDFMMFFSSAQSFVGNAGQSNYAAGCTFKDAFAHALNQHHIYSVKTINWGYWGSVGVAATDEQRHRFAAQGILSIEPHEGMEAVTRILAHDVTQIMPLKAEAHVLEKIGIERPHFHSSHPEDDLEPGIFVRENDDNVIIEPYSENRLPDPPAFAIKEPLENVQNRGVDIVTKPQNFPFPTSEPFPKQHWQEKTLDYVKSQFSKVLKIKKNKLDNKATFEKYGIDSVVVLDINKQFEQDFGQLPTTLLFEHNTIEQLTDYFLSEHQERLSKLFPPPADNLMTENLFHPLPSSEVTTETPPTPLPSVSVENLKKGELEKEAPLSHQKASDEMSDVVSQLSDADVDAIINSLLSK